jgi:tetratricopeptide (TPR) repeat protein
VQFDPALNHLREANSGEYVLIEKVPGSALPIVIPAVVKLGSKQDYYETYYELFNCDNPAAGEVIVLSPAVVDKVAGGWTIREPGFIEIKPDAPPRAVASPLVQIPCPGCGVYGDAGHAFCKSCGSPMLGQQRRESTPSTATSEFATVSQPFETPSYSSPDPTSLSSDRTVSAPEAGPPIPWKGMMGIGGGIVGLAIVIISAVIFSGGSLPGSKPSVESKLDRAISAGNLFSPANENAHDLYYELKKANPRSVERFEAQLFPLLTAKPTQMLNALMDTERNPDPSVANWEEASERLEWANDIHPQKDLAAKAAYCSGRVSYLKKNQDEALKAWNRASELDPAWALPANHIGLIYNERRSPTSARFFLNEAIRRKPDWAVPYNNLGTSFYLERDYVQAETYYRQAIERAPQWARPHAWLGDIAMRNQDYEQAVTEFEAVLSFASPENSSIRLDEIRKKLEEARQKARVSVE